MTVRVKTKEDVEKRMAEKPFKPRQNTLQALEEAMSRVMRVALKRQKRAREFENWLPKDFTGQVYLKVREEFEKVKARIEFLDGEIAKVQGQLKEARAEERKAYVPFVVPSKVIDIFDLTKRVEAKVSNSQFIRTTEALRIYKEKVHPLELRLRKLECEKSERQSELGDLRKMAKLAFEGNIAIVHFLSRQWAKRLGIGFDLLNYLPEPIKLGGSVPVDFAGYALPPAALVNGQPDIDMLSGSEIYHVNTD